MSLKKSLSLPISISDNLQMPKYDEKQNFASSSSSASESTNVGIVFQQATLNHKNNQNMSNENATVDMKNSRKKTPKSKKNQVSAKQNTLHLPSHISTLALNTQGVSGLFPFTPSSTASTPTVTDLYTHSPLHFSRQENSPKTPRKSALLSVFKSFNTGKSESKSTDKVKNKDKKMKPSKSSKNTAPVKVKPSLRKSLSSPIIQNPPPITTSQEEFIQTLPLFIQKIWEIVCSNQPGLVGWSTSGESFFVFNRERFATEIIPKHFKHNNFSSFVRQMNFYGFRKVKQSGQPLGPNDAVWEFRNPYFQRGKPNLLVFIKRGHTEQERMIRIEEEDARQGLDIKKSSSFIIPPSPIEEEVDELNISTHPSIAHLQNSNHINIHSDIKDNNGNNGMNMDIHYNNSNNNIKSIKRTKTNKSNKSNKTNKSNNKNTSSINCNNDNAKIIISNTPSMNQTSRTLIEEEINSVHQRLDRMATRLLQIKDLNCKKSPQIEHLLVELIEEVQTIQAQNQTLEKRTQNTTLTSHIEDQLTPPSLPQGNHDALNLMGEFLGNASHETEIHKESDKIQFDDTIFNKVQDDISTISSNYSSSIDSSNNDPSDVTSPKDLSVQNEILSQGSQIHRASTQFGLVSASTAFSSPHDIVESLKEDKEEENVIENFLFSFDDSMYINQNQNGDHQEGKAKNDTVSSGTSITNEWMDIDII